MLSGDVRLGATGAAAKAVCILVHGRGQSPEEMEEQILSRLSAADIAFVLPRAAGRTWYDARATDHLTDETRRQLIAATGHLRAAIESAKEEFPGRPMLLAGFSQGACLSIEYLCAGLPSPEALVAFTGCRVGTSADDRADAFPRDLPVYLSGADADPWIPLSAFAEAAVSLGRAGAALRADVFPGRGHEVSDGEIAMLSAILSDLAQGSRPAMIAARP